MKYPLWTQEQAISFECARDAITHASSIYFAELYKEQKKEIQSVEKIKKIEYLMDLFDNDLKNLSIHDEENLIKVRKKYGDIVKKYNSTGDIDGL